MAAKKKEESGGSILDDIINSEFTMMKDLSKEEEAKEFIDSGNYALNYICSKRFDGAYPVGQISMFYGLSGTGKSMLPAIASKDPKISRVIVLDSEGGGTGKSLFQFINAPMEKVRYMTVQTLDSYRVNKENGKIEEISDKEVPSKMITDTYEYHMGLILIMKKLLYALEYNHSDEKILIIIDSISNMKSVRASLLGGEDMGKTNKLLNQLFSSLDNTLSATNTTVLFANKVYTNLNNPYDPWVIAGGQSVIYNPSINIKLTAMSEGSDITDAQMKEEKLRRKTALGNSLKVIRATISKSRFGTEGRNAWVVLDSTYGLTKNSGLFDLLYDFGAIKKNGTRYSVPGIFVDDDGNDISFFKKDFLELFGKNEKEYIEKLQLKMNEIEEDIKKKRLNLNVNDIDEAEEAMDEDEISNTSMLSAMEAEMEPSGEEA